MARRIGDRRGADRFQISGELGGTLNAGVRLAVLNMGSRGALVESPVALAPGSVHWMNAVIDDEVHAMQVRVCHARPANAAGGPFLIGVEFVAVTAATRAFIERHGGNPPGPVEPR